MVNYTVVKNRKNNILIRGVNWIGDAVMSMPAIYAIRHSHPDSHISLLIKPFVAPLFENNPSIDEIIIYDDSHKGIFGKFRLARMLRKKRFQKAILLQNAVDAALTVFLAGIPERIGYDSDARGFLLTHKIPQDRLDRKIHHIDYYLNLLKNAGLDSVSARPWIYLTLEERESARQTLSQLRRPILGINPGATYGSAKRWMPERFAEVAKWFQMETGGSIVIFGGKNEVGIAQEIDKHIFDSKLFLAGSTGLRELAALISECDVFVTNDSGPMHMADALITPLVAIFGSTSPELTGPTSPNTHVLYSRVSCRPCFDRTCGLGDLRCMSMVRPDEVFFKIKEGLPTKKAVFFDRDGTLCRDADYLNQWEGLEIFEDIKSIKKLKEAGYVLIGVSNQSGIKRGIVNEEFTKSVNEKFINEYGFDDFFYCPHGPDDGCSCRKPEPAMALWARAKHRIDFKKSFVVGDKDADMLLGKNIGAKTVLVKTGKQQSSEYADMVCDNLVQLVEEILKNEEGN
ncbi:MAG: lipopolysaccharide heptosyltransferase II [Dissulfurispiraceae bacterium]|jgi:heptosyltransferase-2|nr:lipopolysaccharide heptosyltransferase II [Dissulfurispiraceae bacterium]